MSTCYVTPMSKPSGTGFAIWNLADPITARHVQDTGLGAGWRCLEVGAGGGSIARWLGEQVGVTGSVVATDLDVHRLTDLPSNVKARRHDILADDLERGAYDLVHGRAVLQHLSDPEAGLTRMANAVAPGGWLVIEENDLGLFTMSGPPQAARATAVMHDLTSRWPLPEPWMGSSGDRSRDLSTLLDSMRLP